MNLINSPLSKGMLLAGNIPSVRNKNLQFTKKSNIHNSLISRCQFNLLEALSSVIRSSVTNKNKSFKSGSEAQNMPFKLSVHGQLFKQWLLQMVIFNFKEPILLSFLVLHSISSHL